MVLLILVVIRLSQVELSQVRAPFFVHDTAKKPDHGESARLVREVFELIRSLAADGLTVLLVEQNVAQGLKVADRGYVLTTGHVTATGTAEQLLSDPALLQSYLGGGKHI